MVLLATFIPFFLIAQLPVDDKAWKYGPEYTFLVHANLTAFAVSENAYFGTNVTSRLHCRPKGNDMLSCRMDDLSAVNFDRKTIDGVEMERVDDPNTIKSAELKHHVPFEVKFHNKGVHYLIVPNGNYSDNWKLDMIKNTVNLLSLGTDSMNKPDGVFKDTEDFVLGQCMVKFNFKHWALRDEKRLVKSPDYMLKTVSSHYQGTKETFGLKKERELKNCAPFTPHPFGFVNLKDVLKRADINYEYSKGHMMVTDKEFDSHASTKYDLVQHSGKRDKLELVEHHYLNLESIVQAKEELPTIENPAMTTIRFDSELKSFLDHKNNR